MRRVFDIVDIQGTVVIGEGERDEAPMLYIGETVGSGKGPEVTSRSIPSNAPTRLPTADRTPCP